jgi:isochorismate pyruvate lyase
VAVSGTAPVAADGKVVAPGDGYAQTARCLEIVRAALEELGGSLADVVRTRMFVTDIARWEEFGRAHREAFGTHPPATTMVEVSALIDPAMLIEVEADAILSGE